MDAVQMMAEPGFMRATARLENPEHGIHVGLERGIELLGRDIQNGLLCDLSRRIAHHEIQAAELVRGRFDEAIAERLLSDISRQCNPFASGTADELDHFGSVGLFGR